MLKIATRAHVHTMGLIDRVSVRRHRRGLTLVEYVLGAAIIAVIALALRTQLTAVANETWTRIQAVLG